MLIFIVIVVIILLILGLVLLGSYNSLIGFRQKVSEGLSDIDIQLKRRYDLIPNLINTIKGATKFESETLEKVIQARNQAQTTTGMGEDRQQAETVLTQNLRQVFALSESYPDLKASANFLELQRELASTEDKILAARRFYNQIVSDYNSMQEQIPGVFVAKIAKCEMAKFFELENPTQERKNIAVEF
jgi:LemA protein